MAAFEAGHSGNPNGTRNKAPLAVEALHYGEAKGITRNAIELKRAATLRPSGFAVNETPPPSLIVRWHSPCRECNQHPTP